MPETVAGVTEFASTLFAAAPEAAGAAEAGTAAVGAGEGAAGGLTLGEGAAFGGEAAGGIGAAGTAGAVADTIPEVLVTAPLEASSGLNAGELASLGIGAGTALNAANAVGALGSGATGGTPVPGTSAGAQTAKIAPGASGSSVGGSTSPSIANASPGADIGGPGAGNSAFDIKPLAGDSFGAPGGAYQPAGSNSLVFGSDQASNLKTASPGFLDSIVGSGSSSAPLGVTNLSGGAAAGTDAASKGIGGAIADSLGVTNPIAKAGISALPGALPLAYTAIKGEQNPKGYNALTSESQQLAAQGKAMSDYLANGTLPPGVQTALNSAKNSAITAIKSSYAARGQSGSSAEAEDIANAEAQIVGQGAQTAMGLFQQGASEQQVAAQIQEGLLNSTIQQDAQFSTALGTFASALAGSSGAGTLKLQVA